MGSEYAAPRAFTLRRKRMLEDWSRPNTDREREVIEAAAHADNTGGIGGGGGEGVGGAGTVGALAVWTATDAIGPSEGISEDGSGNVALAADLAVTGDTAHTGNVTVTGTLQRGSNFSATSTTVTATTASGIALTVTTVDGVGVSSTTTDADGVAGYFVATNGGACVFAFSSGDGPAVVVQADSDTGYALELDNDGAGGGALLSAEGIALYTTSNGGTCQYNYTNVATANANLEVVVDHASATGSGIKLRNDGTGYGVEVSALLGTGLYVVSDVRAAYFYSNTTSRTAGIVEVREDNAGSSAPLVKLTHDGTGAGVESNVHNKVTASDKAEGKVLEGDANGLQRWAYAVLSQCKRDYIGSTFHTDPGTVAANALVPGSDGLYSLNNGGAGTGISRIASEQNRIGIIQLTTGTTTTGRQALGELSPTNFLFGSAQLLFRAVVRLPALSTALAEYQAFIGFGDSYTTHSTDGAYFHYNRAGGVTNWDCYTRNNGTGTATGSGVAVAANTWVELMVIADAAGANVYFYIDGTLVATKTANIPTTAGREFGRVFFVIATAGVLGKLLQIDAYDVVSG